MHRPPTLLLLGEPELRKAVGNDGSALEALAGSRSTTVLALLALEPGRVVTLDRLLASVWPEVEGSHSRRGKVHVQVSRLRARLEGSGLQIASRHGGYVLVGDPDAIDIQRFRALAGRAREEAADGDWEAVLSSTSAADELWRGEPFSSMHAPELELERSHLLERRRVLLQLRCQALFDAAAPDEALLIANELRESDAYAEFPVWACMTALARLGRRADALEAFDHYRRILAEHLGLDPSQQLRELQARVLRDDHDAPGPAQRTQAGVAGRPSARFFSSADDRDPVDDPGQLVGRAIELARVSSLVADLRDGRPSALLVEGEAGIGRTALAHHAAVQGERQGVRVVRARGLDAVPMATLSVWRHVGSRLGLSEGQLDRVDTAPTSVTIAALVDGVLAAVRDQPTLLVFDDLHRVDDASMQGLQCLVGEIWDEPLAVVATREFHGAPSTAAKEQAWTRLSQERLATMLQLRPLGLADVAFLAGVSEQEAEPLLERTGGNPRLLRELLADGLPDPDTAELPCGVVSIVRSRLVAVPPLTRSLVTAAALAGTRFDPHEVAASLGIDHDAVAPALRPAVEVGLVRPLRHGPGWAFRHEVEREGVLDVVVDRHPVPEEPSRLAGVSW